MSLFQQWGKFMTSAAQAHAAWELDTSRRILGDPKRIVLLLLLLLPIFVFGPAVAAQVAEHAAAAGDTLPDVLGGKKAYSPAFYSTGIFIVSILIGLGAGLILVSLARDFNLSAFLIELVWLLISLYGLARIFL